MSNIRDTYNQQGYYHAKGIINTAQVNALLDELAHPFRLQLEKIGDSQANSYAWDDAIKALFNADLPKYIQCMKVMRKLGGVTRYMMNDDITSVLKELGYKNTVVPDIPVVHLMSQALRIPNGYYGFDAHQDWHSMQGSLDSLIAWAPLTQVKEDSNPLEIIPGSHFKGLIEAEAKENESTLSKEAYDENDFVPVLCSAGDVLFMSTFTIHRSGHKSNGNVRIACSTRYENMADDTYTERGWPSAYLRSVHRELYTPNFPSQEQVKSIFNAA